MSVAASADVGLRSAAVQVGYWLGWASILAVLGALALDGPAPHRVLLVAATAIAAAGNTLAMIVPWRDWLVTRRGRALLDVWCAGLLAFVAVLVVAAGSSFALLLFLAAPFIAVVQTGRRRGAWLGLMLGVCVAVAIAASLPAGPTTMRLTLVAVAVVVALAAVRAIRRHAAATELERARVREADHRIKNDLQAAADLVLLGGTPEELAGRLRAISIVHRLLTEGDAQVGGRSLLDSIAAGAGSAVTVEADDLQLDPSTAQALALVANELVTNAVRHGAAPIVVRLRDSRLTIDDAGSSRAAPDGVGLDLVRRIVEHGLDGRFELRARRGGGTTAEVVFTP